MSCDIVLSFYSGSQWTNAQIAEHYSQCIKLSSENVSQQSQNAINILIYLLENQCQECIWSSLD